MKVTYRQKKDYTDNEIRVIRQARELDEAYEI